MIQAKINKKVNSFKSKGWDASASNLPKNKYDIIYADPPWDYGGCCQYAPIKEGEKTASYTSSAQWKYPTMKLSMMKDMPIEAIAKDDCLLFMWVSSPMLARSIELGTSWGFSYSTIAFVWNKIRVNPGRYTLSQCEICLVFKKGRIPKPRGARNIRQYIEEKRGKHSQKPVDVRKRINDMFPDLDKIELFARDDKILDGENNWSFWGNEINK